MATAASEKTVDSVDCPCHGGTLDRLIQPAILTVLAEQPLHGYRLAERLGEMSRLRAGRPDGSGIYRILKAMERKGLVVASWDTSHSGPAKKSYRITPAGKRCLRRWIGTLKQYRDDISSLLRSARRAVDS